MECKKKTKELNNFFLESNCEKNEGGTRNLVLRGGDIFNKLGRRIVDSDLTTIIIFLRNHQEIVALEMPYNKISNCGLSALADFLIERPVIRHLNLIGNNIDSHGITYLVNLGERLTLYSLRLTGNKIGDEGGKLLSKLICEKTPLKFLDLADTHQTISGLAYIMTALMPSKGGTQTLEYIDIGRPLCQKYHQVNDAHTAEFLSQVLKDNTSLKELHLQQFQLDFRDVEILLEGLLANRTLICLDLNNNNIGDDGVGYLCEYLKTTPPLECLMIAANEIGDLGALSLSQSLPFSNIKLLDLSKNHITDEGMSMIFYAIKKTEKLRALFLWGNTLSHTSLVILQRLYNSNILSPENCDIQLYCTEKELHASWNTLANRYTHRFYCETNYEPKKILKLHPQPPMLKPHIYYKYHIDNDNIGFPMCEWKGKITNIKYSEPD